MGVDKTHISYTHTLSWISILWLGCCYFLLFLHTPYNCNHSKKIHLHAAGAGVWRSRSMFPFLLFWSHKSTISLSFAPSLGDGSRYIDWSKPHTHKAVFHIATSHHITQNFRLAWRTVDDANADDESERYRSDRKMDRIVLRIQSIRIESSPQPFSVTNFQSNSKWNWNKRPRCLSLCLSVCVCVSICRFFIRVYCMLARLRTPKNVAQNAFPFWAWFQQKKEERKSKVIIFGHTHTVYIFNIGIVSCAMSFIIESQTTFLWCTFWCSITRPLVNTLSFCMHCELLRDLL